MNKLARHIFLGTALAALLVASPTHAAPKKARLQAKISDLSEVLRLLPAAAIEADATSTPRTNASTTPVTPHASTTPPVATTTPATTTPPKKPTPAVPPPVATSTKPQASTPAATSTASTTTPSFVINNTGGPSNNIYALTTSLAPETTRSLLGGAAVLGVVGLLLAEGTFASRIYEQVAGLRALRRRITSSSA